MKEENNYAQNYIETKKPVRDNFFSAFQPKRNYKLSL